MQEKNLSTRVALDTSGTLAHYTEYEGVFIYIIFLNLTIFLGRRHRSYLHLIDKEIELREVLKLAKSHTADNDKHGIEPMFSDSNPCVFSVP